MHFCTALYVNDFSKGRQEGSKADNAVSKLLNHHFKNQLILLRIKNIIILRWFGDPYKKTSILKPDL